MADTGRRIDGYITEPVPKLWEAYPTSESALSTGFAMGYDTQGLTQMVVRGHLGQSDIGVAALAKSVLGYEEKYIDQETASTIGYNYGLSYSEPVRETKLSFDLEGAKKEMARKSIMARLPNNWSTATASLAGGLAASVVDPIEAVASMIPVVGAARKAQLAAKLGVTGGRVAAGVIEGVAGAALVEYPRYALLQQAQLDYDTNDLIANIAFGGIMGGGFHYIGGRISDRFNKAEISESPSIDLNLPERIEKTSIETKFNALRTGVSDFMSGRQIDVEPILRMDKSFTDEYTGFVRVGRLDWRVPDFSPENMKRIDAKIDRQISVALENKFESRAAADTYIRENAKETGSLRTDYLVEKSDDGKFDVYKIRDTEVVAGEDGTTAVFKRKEDAERFVKESNANPEKAPEDTFSAIKTSGEKSGRVNQEYIVIKGKNLSDADLKKIKDTLAFFKPEYQRIDAPQVKQIPTNEINNAIRGMIESRTGVQNKVAVLDNPKFEEPKKYSDSISEIDDYSAITDEEFSFIQKTLSDEKITDDALRQELINELEAIKAYDAAIADLEAKKQNYMALAECMVR